MRNQAALAQASQQQSTFKTFSAPVGGLNARDPIAEMQPTDAVILDNYFCTPFKVRIRAGSTTFATGLPSNANTLMNYESPTISKLFAASGSGIYDVTSGGAVGAAVVSGLTSDKFQFTNFSTPGGNFLIACNGSDKLREYDGTTWNTIDGASTPAITGVSTSSLFGVEAHKFRLWFIESGSLRAWYLPVSSIGGVAQQLDLSSLCSSGGSLVAIGTWTLDGGTGTDDYLIFITSQGQVVAYRGTDPASASTWAMAGIYNLGSPVGKNCMVRYMGDLLIITQDGLVPLSQAMMSSRVSNRIAISDKIQHLISSDVTNYSSLYGWQTMLYPPENMLILNVPTGTGTSKQYAMNTISQAWSSYSGWNAASWVMWGNHIYFGTGTKVIKAWTGTADDSTQITAEALQAFSNFGEETQKVFSACRPIVSFDNPPALLIGMNVDFDQTAPIGVPSFSSSTQALWDTALWDIAVWGGSESIKRDWQTINGIGTWGGMHLLSQSTSTQMSWYSTDVIYQPGAVF